MKEYPLNKNYLVTRDGKIKSKRFNKWLTPKVNWDGYHRIQIWEKGKANMISWHRVIAETYIPNPENKPYVNHKNGIKTDNNVENLEWVTQKENIAHAWRTGLSTQTFNHPSTSHGVECIYAVMGDMEFFPSISEASRKTGMGRGTILKYIKSGEADKQGNKWRYCKTSND